MTDPAAARSFLLAEVEALGPFDFVATGPAGTPLHVVEVTRGEGGGLEVRVPGRPPVVPELPVEDRRALRERGFASEKPDDPTRPWVKAAPDAGAAVDLVQRVLSEVFGEKPDCSLDVAHGSHRVEHEARKRLALARERIEKVLADYSDKKIEKDADGDYVLPVNDVHVMVAPRALPPSGTVAIRVFAITNVGVNVAPELGLFLARLNFGLMFGRFALDTEHRSIWFDETVLGEQFREDELRFALDVVAQTADQWDDQLKQMFGGVTYQEVVTGRAEHRPPPSKPGNGAGYL